jgi:hypothetical protein
MSLDIIYKKFFAKTFVKTCVIDESLAMIERKRYVWFISTSFAIPASVQRLPKFRGQGIIRRVNENGEKGKDTCLLKPGRI